MSEKLGRKALFVGVPPDDQKENREKQDTISQAMGAIVSYLEKAMSGDVSGNIEDLITEPSLKPLAAPLASLIARFAEIRHVVQEKENIFSRIPAPIAIKDRDNRVIEANDAYNALFACDSGSNTASPAVSVRQVSGESPASVFTTGTVSVSEIEVIRPGSEPMIWHQHIIPCGQSGEVRSRALYVYENITEFRTLEKETKITVNLNARVSAFSNALFQGNPHPIIHLNKKLEVIDANAAFITEFSIPIENLNGIPIRDLPFEQETGGSLGDVTRGVGLHSRRVFHMHPDGRNAYEISVIPFEKPDGHFIIMFTSVGRYLDAIDQLNERIQALKEEISVARGQISRDSPMGRVVSPNIPENGSAGEPSVSSSTGEEDAEETLPGCLDSTNGSAIDGAAALPDAEEVITGEETVPGGTRLIPGMSTPKTESALLPDFQDFEQEMITADEMSRKKPENKPDPVPDYHLTTPETPEKATPGRDAGDTLEKHRYGVVEFELGGDHYALDITITREIVEMMPITPIPRSCSYLCGAMNLRGEITNIINIYQILGIQEITEESTRKIIVLTSEAGDGENIGIVVDDVQSVIQVGEEEIERLSDSSHYQNSRLIKGIIKVKQDTLEGKKREQHLIIWLDMMRMIQDLINQGKQA
jgi:purine-binding chemotaxis protein CheW